MRMNNHHIFLTALLVLVLCGCAQDDLSIETSQKAVITGNAYKALAASNVTGSDSYSYFDSGDQILASASGGLALDNDILTYSGSQWDATSELQWTDISQATTVTALYPVHQSLSYTEDDLYTDNLLEDILYANQTYAAGEDIDLQFSHLFSQLTVHLDGVLQTDFQGIEIVCPAVITEVRTASAEIVLDTDRSHTVSITEASTSGDYSVLVPPAEEMAIGVTIHTSDKKYTAEIEACPFVSNQEYTYNILAVEDVPGIRTTSDLIAFSQLIKDSSLTSYNGKTLQDFGKTVDGVTTYYLLEDLDFNGVSVTNLVHIGFNMTYPNFYDVFDGKGHTISNLTLQSGFGTTGLFGTIGTGGVVKNLHMKSCSANVSASTASGVGTLVGVNHGTIMDCSAEDCTLVCEQNSHVGGIAGSSDGTIINCYIKDTQLTGLNYTGGITGYATGIVLNCFSTGNTIKSTSSYSGGICGYCSSSSVSNCYVYGLKLTLTTKRKVFIGYGSSATLSHCLYPSGTSSYLMDGSGNTTSSNKAYDTSSFTVSSTPVYQLLNDWITGTAPSLYPDLTFTYWTEGDGIPATFEE